MYLLNEKNGIHYVQRDEVRHYHSTSWILFLSYLIFYWVGWVEQSNCAG